MCEPETFWTLFMDPNHWLFELFLMVLFDGIIGALAWPFLRKHWSHHKARDEKEGVDKQQRAARGWGLFNEQDEVTKEYVDKQRACSCDIYDSYPRKPLGGYHAPGEKCPDDDECNEMCGTDYPHNKQGHSQ